MNKVYLFALAMGMIGLPSSWNSRAQNLSPVERGDTVVLQSADGYAAYQWQVSSDKRYFVDLPGGKTQNMLLKVNAPGFYRIKVTDAAQHESYLDTINVVLKEVTYHSDYSVSGAGHGYVETVDGNLHASGINIPEDRVDGVAGTTKKLTSWVNGNAMAVYYFNHPADIVDTEMLLKVKAGAKVSFRVKVYDPERMDSALVENIVAIMGTGQEQKVPLVAASFSRKAYFRYQIECLSGWNSIIEISKFNHYSPSSLPTYKAAYRSSPSVHLGRWRSTDPMAPQGDAYNWCYQEVMMPKQSDILGTYVMSLGVLKGYMGIQVNGYDELGPIHGVLFSMWDDGSTDKDPNLPDYCRAKALDHGEDVVVKRFGNEGTGVQTFKHGHYWSCDTYVQFITHSRKEMTYYYKMVNGTLRRVRQTNTLVSAWYNAQDGKGWQYMATLRVPNKSQYFGSWYSFLENYNAATGQAVRKGYYRNGYARSKNGGVWFHCNSVNFGHTDGGNRLGARNDFSQGVSDEEEGAFFMVTGGYLDSHLTAKEMPLNKVNTAVDTIDLKALEARVDQAIAHEKNIIEEEELFQKSKIDKTGWKVIDFSSEEANGEGTNGRAAQVIDGDANTYWHSQWKGSKASYPHYLKVDMRNAYEMRGMEITMSGGSKRYLKAFKLYVSDDNKIWRTVYSENEAPDMARFRFVLQEPVVARYFKFEITDGRATDGAHVRVNEIDVCGVPAQTGICDAVAGSAGMEVSCRKNEMYVSFCQDMPDANIALYANDGACVFSDSSVSLLQGESLHIPMCQMPEGVYVLSCTSGNRKYTKSVLWRK